MLRCLSYDIPIELQRAVSVMWHCLEDGDSECPRARPSSKSGLSSSPRGVRRSIYAFSKSQRKRAQVRNTVKMQIRDDQLCMILTLGSLS